MHEIAEGEAGLILTGPPYFPAEIESVLLKGVTSKDQVTDLVTQICIFAWRLRPVFEECARVLRPGGRLIMQTRDVRLRHRLVPVEAIHRQLAEAVGLTCFTRHLWRPIHQTLARHRLGVALLDTYGPMPSDPEIFVVMHKSHEQVNDVSLAPSQIPTDIQDEDTALLSQDVLRTDRGHLPCPHRWQSPVPVLRALIRAHSRPGDLIVDPFAGGGSTLVVAQQLGRRSIGYEIDLAAFELAQKNLSASSVKWCHESR